MTAKTSVAFATLTFGAIALAHFARALPAAAVVLWYAALFLPYAAMLWACRGGEAPSLRVLLGAAIAARIAIAFAEPLLSDDIFRYVWEGRVTVAGFNPFALAPNAPELATLRDAEIWPRINHPEISTIYPPIAQYFFAAVGVVGGGTILLRLGLVALEAAALLAANSLATRHAWSEPRRAFALALYAFNPLVMLEVAWSGHLDVLAWAPLTLALLLIQRETWHTAIAAGALLGFSIGAKFLGLLLFPWLVLRRGDEPWRTALPRRFATVGVALLIVASSYLGFASAGPRLFSGLGTYAASWRANDGLFRAYEAAAHELLQGPEDEKTIYRFDTWDEAAMHWGFTKEWEGRTLPNTSFAANQISETLAKFLAVLFVALALGWTVFVVRDPVYAAMILLGTLYISAPTVHPWYVAWLVPLCAVRPHPAVLAFSAASLVAYIAWVSSQSGTGWLIPWWAVAFEYGTVLAVTALFAGRQVDGSA